MIPIEELKPCKSSGFLTRSVQLLMIPIEELKRRHQLRVDRTDVLFLMIPIEELKLDIIYTEAEDMISFDDTY